MLVSETWYYIQYRAWARFQCQSAFRRIRTVFVVLEMFRVCARTADLPQSVGPFVADGTPRSKRWKSAYGAQVRQEALPHPRGAAAKTARNSALPLTYGNWRSVSKLRRMGRWRCRTVDGRLCICATPLKSSKPLARCIGSSEFGSITMRRRSFSFGDLTIRRSTSPGLRSQFR